MARKEATFVAETGRDKGKQYLITEMSATKGEKWATKALLAMGNAGIDIPEELVSQGMAGLMAVLIRNLLKISFESADLLLDELMLCVQFAPSATLRRPLIEDDIEEIITRAQLKKAVWNLHMDFFLNENQSTSESETPESLLSSLSIKPRPKR